MFIYYYLKLIKLIKFIYSACSTIFMTTLHPQTIISNMLQFNVTTLSITITNYALKKKRNI